MKTRSRTESCPATPLPAVLSFSFPSSPAPRHTRVLTQAPWAGFTPTIDRHLRSTVQGSGTALGTGAQYDAPHVGGGSSSPTRGVGWGDGDAARRARTAGGVQEGYQRHLGKRDSGIETRRSGRPPRVPARELRAEGRAQALRQCAWRLRGPARNVVSVQDGGHVTKGLAHRGAAST